MADPIAPHTDASSGLGFRIADDPVARHGAAEFTSGFEAGTIQLFDRVLPLCRQMVDIGAYIGLTALHAATHGVQVWAFEPNPVSHDLLQRNVAANPGLATRMHLSRHGLAAHDGTATLYAKAQADSGASLHPVIERAGLVAGRRAAEIELRAAAAVLRGIGVGADCLLKIDAEGAEYEILPAIAGLLAERKPWLHVSFHPFNLVRQGDAYGTELARLRAMVDVAQALAPYRLIHVWSQAKWETFDAADRPDFLRHYLLKPKSAPRVRSPLYGFVDGVAFSDQPLPG